MSDTTTLLFNPTPAQIDTLTLDASITENHVGEVEITEHPIEKGADVTDHARPKPASLTLEGLISETPVNRTQAQRATLAAGGAFDPVAATADVAGVPGYAQAAYSILLALLDSKKLFTVVTALRTYDNMILTSLSVPKNAKTGAALAFTAQLREVKIVQNKTITTVVAKEPKAHPKVPTGDQASQLLKDASAGFKRKTIAKSLSDNVGLTPHILPTVGF